MTYSMIFYIITAIITASAAVIWWTFRSWANRIDAKFDMLIKSIQDLGVKDAKQDEQLGQIREHQRTHDTRLNDHSERIRNIEIQHGNEQRH